MERSQEATGAAELGAIARFVAPADREAAAQALAYTCALVEGRADAGRVHAFCYEFAAAGIDYARWPEMVVALLAEGAGGDDLALERARRDALAMSLMDFGENESFAARRDREDR
jgi:hypothetical protein